MTRHYCKKCGGRVFPFDKYEALTDAPAPGKLGRPVLLHSCNANSPDNRVAWCFSCNKWVLVRRLLESEYLLLYLNRRGVIVRKG